MRFIMVKEISLTCINCPMGCPLTVKMKDGTVVDVAGYTCKRGKIYGEKEVTNPTRIVTSTVSVTGGWEKRVPVKTKEDIPKGRIFSCMEEIKKLVVKAPVFTGDVLLENVAGTGVDVVATKTIPCADRKRKRIL